MQQTRKTVLVIGANGYVGHGIATTLARAGFKVYGTIRQEKYSQYLALQEIIPVIGNFQNTEWTEKLGSFDVIINTTEALEDQEKFSNDMVALVTKIAKQQTKKPLFIYTSGIKIYGDTGRANEPGFHSVNEESPYNPLFFAVHRLKAVERCEASEDFYTATVIPGMIYGRGQSYYGPWIKQAATGDKISVFGTPETVWHSVHIDDLADVYARLVDLGEKAHKKKYNVVNDKYERFEDIMKAISGQFGGKHEIVYVDPIPGHFSMAEAVSAWIENEKVKKELGWVPKKVNFIESIEENILAWKAAEKDEFAQTVQPIKID